MARRTTTATDTDPKDDPKDSDAPNDDPKDDGANEGNGGDDSPDNGLEGRIREIVREVVAPLLESGGGNGRRSPDDEGEMERRVGAAMTKLRADEERERRLKNVEERVEKVTERPPARGGVLGKVQRFMWGEDE